MLRIKFAKVGKKKQPTFRLVITERGSDPWGKVVENVGWKNPKTKETVLKEERIKHWIAQGAQPTDSVHNMLVEMKLIEGEKRRTIGVSQKRKARLEAAKATKEQAAS